MAPLVWFITGCSSGFGEQFVHQALARGDKVIATSRNAATKLRHLEGTGASILDLDVSAPPEEIAAKVDEAAKIYGGIDVLVNNAGYIESGLMEELTHERWLRSYNTNVFGHISVTHAVLPHMRAKKSGTIAFIGSIGGWKAEPGGTAYCSGKFALEGLSEALNAELAPLFNIRSIIFEPGFFRTPVLTQTNVRHLPLSIPDYAGLNEMVQQFQKSMTGRQPGDPVKGVARMIEVITGTGLAAGKEMPIRLPLGKDAFKLVREKCEATLRLCEEWEELITSTDLDGVGDGEGGKDEGKA